MARADGLWQSPSIDRGYRVRQRNYWRSVVAVATLTGSATTRQKKTVGRTHKAIY